MGRVSLDDVCVAMAVGVGARVGGACVGEGEGSEVGGGVTQDTRESSIIDEVDRKRLESMCMN